MTKATHTGTCQCCGATQKLPNGKLSLHGYTTQFGFFQGTCAGAKELPFEQSKDLIEMFIENALERAEELDNEAAGWEANWTIAWRRSYRSHRECEYGQKSGYFWEQAEIKLFTRDDGWEYLGWADYDERQNRQAATISYDTKDAAEATKELNAIYAKGIRKMAQQARQYAEWQKERIIGWKPQELTAI